jgi:hypothetical protein
MSLQTKQLNLFRKASNIWHQFILGGDDAPEGELTGTRPGSLTGRAVVPPTGAGLAANRQAKSVPRAPPIPNEHEHQVLPWAQLVYYPRWHMVTCTRC